MYNLKISTETAPLTIEIHYFGLLTASYVYSLWEKDSNLKVDSKQGNNLNGDDDIYQLPVPNTRNLGRLIEVFSTLNNPEAESKPETVALKIIQNGDLLFTDEKPSGVDVGHKTFSVAESLSIAAGSTVLNDIFILLR